MCGVYACIFAVVAEAVACEKVKAYIEAGRVEANKAAVSNAQKIQVLLKRNLALPRLAGLRFWLGYSQ